MSLGYTTSDIVCDQKVKDQGHRVTKCKKAIEWRAWVCTLSSAQPLVCLNEFEPAAYLLLFKYVNLDVYVYKYILQITYVYDI